MDVLGERPIDHRRYAGIEAEEARIGRAGPGPALHLLAEDPAVAVLEQRLGLGPAFEHVTLGLEAVIMDLRRVVGEEAVLARRLGDRPLDLPAHLGQIHAGKEADAHIEGAPGRHARGPVAADDLADHEVDGMVVAGEGRVLLLVPARLEAVESLDQGPAGLDGVGAGAGIGDMHRAAADLDLEPHHATWAAPSRLALGSGMMAASAR